MAQMRTRPCCDLPTGAVTLLFTDIAGSTQLLQCLRPRYADVLAEYRALLRFIFQAHDGQEVGTQGDSFFVAFPSALDAAASSAARAWGATIVAGPKLMALFIAVDPRYVRCCPCLTGWGGLGIVYRVNGCRQLVLVCSPEDQPSKGAVSGARSGR